MLIKFTVSNSRSIADKLEFSAIATNDSTLPEALIDVPKYGIKLLKTMALFGANASGKSNVLKAMKDALWVILNKNPNSSFHLLRHFNDCRNKGEKGQQNIEYSFDIFIDDVYYNYSFAHNLTIVSETLTIYPTNEKSEVIFSRTVNSADKNEWFFCKDLKDDESIEFIRKSTSARQLFLTVANQDFNADEIVKNPILEAVFAWFNAPIYIHAGGIPSPVQVGVNFDDLITFIKSSKTNKKLLLYVAELADIPIKDIQIFEIAKGDYEDGVTYLYIHPKDYNHTQVVIKTTHSNEKNASQFNFLAEESDGTQQFMGWLGHFLLKMQEDAQPKIFVVDELGTSLHPLLTQLLVKIFYNKKLNPHNAQLIFTTHEVKLMDKKIMRSDQLYLVSKPHDSTIIERVSDYPETDKYNRLDNIYTQGALGAIANINEAALNRIKI